MASVNRNQPRRAASSESKYTVMEFMAEFPDDATCLQWLWNEHYSRDGEHADCPKCGVERKFHRVASRPSYSCDVCGHHIHPTANTIFHKSSTSLHLWFHAIFLMSTTRTGVSAKHLERELGVTYKTAWRMAHLIRKHLMEQDEGDGQLGGEVEADETWWGGRPRGRQLKGKAYHRERKSVIFGAVERGGRIRAEVVDSTSGPTLRGAVKHYVMPSSTIFTDEYQAYNPLAQQGYTHHRINHGAKIYVEGNVHTQTIEGFWGLMKNGIRGTYHAVSHKHLQTYLNEYAWRYNHRDDRAPMFFTLIRLAGSSVA